MVDYKKDKHILEIWVQKIGAKDGYALYAYMRYPHDYDCSGRILVEPNGKAYVVAKQPCSKLDHKSYIGSKFVKYLIEFFPELAGDNIKKTGSGDWIVIHDRIDPSDISTAACLAKRNNSIAWSVWISNLGK